VKDFLSITDVDAAGLKQLLDRTDFYRNAGRRRQPLFEGKSVAMLFEKPSTRTRVSFEVAISRLGCTPVTLGAAESQLGRGETIEDTGRTLARYVDAVVWRTFGHDRLEQMAAAADIPIINALSDLEHPCQIVADLATIRWRLGPLESAKIAWVGDGNNVAHSLMLGAAMTGAELVVVCPDEYRPDEAILARAEQIAASVGGFKPVVTSSLDAVDGVDVIYTDVWTSMGSEAEAQARLEAFKRYQVNEELVARSPDAKILHCLPAHRGEEITAGVIDDADRSLVWDQAEHRVYAQCAVLEAVLR
jgi:ornithine carbamoyltransferase